MEMSVLSVLIFRAIYWYNILVFQLKSWSTISLHSEQWLETDFLFNNDGDAMEARYNRETE